MAEYIEKAALMGLIESEARRWGDDYDWWQVLADIEDFKPSDVRPVTFCRDCFANGLCSVQSVLFDNDLNRANDFFCANGKRKEFGGELRRS